MVVDKIGAVPPTSSPDGPARPVAELSAAELNAAIRALWMAGRGHPAVGLNDEQRAEYWRLCEQLRQVERGDVTAAA